ncbi:MAG: hypothetical protein HY293_04885 [Planctomycetes bacterium]|nr:hypothetical protein [Planctomycetota bacterium]
MGPEPAPAPRALRLWYLASLIVALGTTVGVCWFARGYEAIFEQMEMRVLPLPTESLLSLGQFVRSAAGTVAVLLLAGVLIALTLKGLFDEVLIKLILANSIWATLIIPFAYLSLHLPIVQIQRALENK